MLRDGVLHQVPERVEVGVGRVAQEGEDARTEDLREREGGRGGGRKEELG